MSVIHKDKGTFVSPSRSAAGVYECAFICKLCLLFLVHKQMTCLHAIKTSHEAHVEVVPGERDVRPVLRAPMSHLLREGGPEHGV